MYSMTQKSAGPPQAFLLINLGKSFVSEAEQNF